MLSWWHRWPSISAGIVWLWGSPMHWAMEGHSGGRPCWNDQNLFGTNWEKTRPPQGLCDLKTCHSTLNFKTTIGIWVYIINDLRLFPVNIGSWTLKEIFLHVTHTDTCSWTLCLCVIDIVLATVRDLAFFLFVILFGFDPNSFSFVWFFFHIGEDVKCCVTCYCITNPPYVRVALL